jgi:CheY-like chemotaxis protein
MNLEDASVLLVEDEPLLCEVMAAWLGRVAARAVCAENGKKALHLLHLDRVDLIVSDVRMPVMDGLALLAAINRARPGRPPVILVTGYSDLTAREAYDCGAEAMLEKPIDRQELLLAMRRALVPFSELCREPRRRGVETKLKGRFTSLASEMEARKIAFGRKGFCIRKAGGLREGPVDFTFEFKDDRRFFGGQGHVRWTAPEEQHAGIEITHLDEPCLSWFLDLLKQRPAVASIPASTASTCALKLMRDVA